MSYEVLQAYIDGYGEHLNDLQIIGVVQGFYAGYYGRAKKPKPLKQVISKLLHPKKSKDDDTPAPDVDVEAFLEMDRRFKERLHQK